MISSSAGIASARSILAISSAWPPAARSSSRAMYMSAPLFGNDTARKSAFDRRRGLDVLHVLGGQRRRGEAAALPVDALVVRQLAAERDARCDARRRRTDSTSSTIRPSSSSSTSPGSRRAAAPCSRGRRASLVAELAVRRRARTARPASSVTLPSANLPTRIFGPCRSAMMPTSRPSLARRSRAPAARALDVVLARAVREVQAHDVDAGGDHALEHLAASLRRGAEGGDDLGGALHGSACTIAGPSRCGLRAAARCFEDLDRRQRLALEEFEEGAAAGRDVADPVGDAVLGDRRERVAAAGDRERAATRRSPRRAPGAAGERVELEHADRAVPDDGAGLAR